MADIKEVEGVYGGVQIDTDVNENNNEFENGVAENIKAVQTENVVGENLPVKTGFWSKFKAFWLKEIKVELTPHQQKIENEINEFLHQEITWEKVHDFLFQEIRFGKKSRV